MSWRATHTKSQQTCSQVGWAWVTALAAATSSRPALVKASGAMRMSEPLPQSRSPQQPSPRSMARDVVAPMSKRPSTV